MDHVHEPPSVPLRHDWTTREWQHEEALEDGLISGVLTLQYRSFAHLLLLLLKMEVSFCESAELILHS